MPDASTVHQLIRSALRQRLLGLANPMPLVAYQGRAFEPPSPQVKWLRETLKSTSSELQTLGPNGRIRHEGVWFLDWYHPHGVGMVQIDQDAGALLALFTPGLSMVYGGQTVTVRQSFRNAEQTEPQWMLTPVRVRWFADTFNTL